jgi:hypothetical protein
MLAISRNLIVNLCLLLASSLGALTVCYFVYDYLIGKSIQNMNQLEDSPYNYSFYNQKGKKLSELNGTLKLVTDPFTIYKNYPNQKSRVYTINDYGFRESYTGEKPYTAIVIGGSAAFGYALDSDSKTFSSKISILNDRYNVINSAVIAFLSGQELSQMVHYLDDFNPQVYIVFDGWNDVAIPYELVQSWPVVNPLIGYNHAFLLIEDRMAEYYRMITKGKIHTDENIKPMGDLFDEEKFSDEILKRYVANISKMRDFSRARGAEFLLVFQPELGNKKSLSTNEKDVLETWNEKFGYHKKKISERYKQLIKRAKIIFLERGISFLDINEEPEFSENPRTVFFDVVHPNELGHQVIANIINHALAIGIPNVLKSHSAALPQTGSSDTSPTSGCTLHFADGWHAWEHNGSSWWRWTDGRGEIRGVISEDSAVLMSGEIFSMQEPNTVDVLVNGEKTATWQINWENFKAFEPVKLYLKRGENRIVFVSHNPASHSPSDSRPLALAVSNLRVASSSGAAVCELRL